MLEFLLLAAAEEGPRPFPEPVVQALLGVVRCDTVAFRAWGLDDGVLEESLAPRESANRLPPLSLYQRFRRDDPHPSAPPSTYDPRPAVSAAGQIATPLVLRDAVDRRFTHTGLYLELMRPSGFRDVMKFFFPPHERVGAALVFDTSGRGFAREDRALLQRLAPALVEFRRNAHLRARTLRAGGRLQSLSGRELTVLARAAAGETNAEIARALVIGVSTVRKHLEHIYEKLDVPNRAAAAAVYTQADGLPGGADERARRRWAGQDSNLRPWD